MMAAHTNIAKIVAGVEADLTSAEKRQLGKYLQELAQTFFESAAKEEAQTQKTKPIWTDRPQRN